MPRVAIVKTGTLKGTADFMPPKRTFVRLDEDIEQIKLKIEETINLASRIVAMSFCEPRS